MEGQLTFRISSGFRWRRTRSSTLTTGIVKKRYRSWLYREPVQGDWGMLFVDKIWFSPFAIGGRERIVGEIRCQWISVFFRSPAKAENKNYTQERYGYIEERVGNLQKSGLKVSVDAVLIINVFLGNLIWIISFFVSGFSFLAHNGIVEYPIDRRQGKKAKHRRRSPWSCGGRQRHNT